MEKQVQKRKERTAKLEREAMDAQARQVEEYKKDQSKISEKLNMEAKKKVVNANMKTQHMTAKIKDTNEQHYENRVEAVLELKANVDAVRAEVATQAEKFVKKQEKKKQQLEDEKETMLAQGLNPYVEFRKKELDEEAASRERKLKAAVEKNKADLASQMAKEQKFLDKQEKSKREAQKYEKQHRESLGPHVIEERNRKYIVERTAAHTEVLDPSGKAARIDPSQITDIADFSFGLGKSSRIPADGMKRITEKIRQELRVDKQNFGEYERLVTGLKKATGLDLSEDNDATDQLNRSMSAPSRTREDVGHPLNSEFHLSELHDFEKLGNTNGIIPGVEKVVTNINFHGDEKLKSTLLSITTEEEGEIASDAKRIESQPSPKYKPPNLSKFERDALDRAKERHHDRIEYGVPQVAGGKLYQGDAFASTPSTILFKDFDVGKVYKKHFVLTNVSYTFNSFKLLELDDNVIDFFVVTFDKPGRMSAGMSCTVEIVFKPQLNNDIFTHIKLLTETGPVNIPLHCLIKRCAPRVVDTELDFAEMIIGQRTTLPVKVVNSQALPTRFTIEAVISSDDQFGESDTGPVAAVENGIAEDSDMINSIAQLRLDPEDIEHSEFIGMEPAAQESELESRVERVKTSVWRKKKREQPQPFVCYLSSNKSLLPEYDEDGKLKNTDDVKEVLVQEGLLGGYDSVTLTVRSAPLTVGFLEQRFIIKFHQVDEKMNSVDENGELVTKEQCINVKVFADELPIYVEEEVVDVKCVLHDRIYRRKLVVKNRGKTACRLQMKVMKRFQHYVEVNPNVFFVQAHSSQSINIKFTPKADIVKRLAHFSLPSDPFPFAALMELPIEIEVINQDLPIFFVVKSLVTASTIEVSEKIIDFGKVYVGQKTSKIIKLRNTSMLPQKIAFVRLKKEFQVQPNDGFAVMLPLEEMEFEIFFGPLSAIEYRLDLTLMTSFNDKYIIPIQAEGVEPPLMLSSTVLHMRTTAPGQRVLDSVLITNNFPHTQSFEIMIPEPLFSWVKISPLAMTLNAGQSCRVEIEYCPPFQISGVLEPSQYYQELVNDSINKKSPFDEWQNDAGWAIGKSHYGTVQWSLPSILDESAKKKSPIIDDGAIESSDDIDGANEDALYEPLPQEEWGVIGKWNVPILVKSKKRANVATGVNSSSEGLLGATIASGLNMTLLNKPLPLFLNIETMTILPQIESDQKELDFGSIAVATRQLKTFKVYNRTNHPIKLKAIGFNAMGPFTLLRPIRPIAPQQSRVVIVECYPKVPGLIVEMLEILTEDETEGGHRLYIPCSVQGLMPMIQLEGLIPPPPPLASSALNITYKETWNSRSGILDFGHVLVTGIAEQNITIKKFTIKNRSTFPIEALITRASCFGITTPKRREALIERTASGLPIISVRPEQVTIQPNSSCEIEVIFRADRCRFLPFREDFDVAVGQTDERLRVGVLGRAWTRQFTLIPDSPLDEPLMNNWLRATVGSCEDILGNHYLENVRKAAREANEEFLINTEAPIDKPYITLKFNDPYDKNAGPESYVVVDPNALVAPAKGKPPKDIPPPNPDAVQRRQTKKLRIVTAKSGIESVNTPAGAKGPVTATFELVLSQAAKDCGIWSFNVDKGTVTAGKDEIIDVICTQPKPRMLGGVSVCSWKTFDATVIIKGGLFPSDEKEESHVPIKLLAFVSI